jgi:hypothetical protein
MAAGHKFRITHQDKRLKRFVMKTDPTGCSEKEPDEASDRLNGDNAGPVVMSEEQRIMFDHTCWHGGYSRR